MKKFSLKRNVSIMALFVIVLFMVAIQFFFEYKENVENTIYDSMYKSLRLEANQNASIVSDFMDNSLEQMDNFALLFSIFDDVHDKEALDVLTKIKVESNFDTLRLTSLDGTSIGANGSVINIANREHFLNALKGQSTISDNLFSYFDEEKIIVICSPIFKNGEVVGAINGSINVSRIEELLGNFRFDGYGYVSLAKSSGKYIATTNANEYRSNLLELLRNVEYKNGSYNTIIDAFNMEESGSAEYYVNGELRYVNYLPLGINDWYLFQVVKHEYIDNMASIYNQYALKAIANIALIIILICSVIFVLLYVLKINGERNLLKLNALINAVPGGVSEITVTNNQIKMLYASDGYRKLMKLKKDESLDFLSNVCLEDRKDLRAVIINSFNNNTKFNHIYRILVNNNLIWIKVEGEVVSSKLYGSVIECIHTNITEEINRTNQFIELSKLDKMTNLLDKVSMEDSCRNILSKNNSFQCCIILIDIDNFKYVNDVHGHLKGDEIIKMLSSFLVEHFRKNDLIGRIGGDEFLVFVEDINSKESIENKIKAILKKINDIKISDENALGISVGVVYFNNNGSYSFEQLYQIADKQLYESKNSGKNNYSIINLD